MAATTSERTNLFAAKLAADFPVVHFEASDDFYWSPSKLTIYHPAIKSAHDKLTLLHEVAHATLGHNAFDRDIDLLKMERQAWELVENDLALRYHLTPSREFVELMIDSYREWLHARSTCPQCSMTGIQTEEMLYHCLGCNSDWRVNEARRCGLKRYAVSI